MAEREEGKVGGREDRDGGGGGVAGALRMGCLHTYGAEQPTREAVGGTNE